MKLYHPHNVNSRCVIIARLELISINLLVPLPNQPPSFLYIFYNMIWSKRFREDIFSNDSSDDEYYLAADKLGDDDIASDSEIRSSNNSHRRFNISNDNSNADKLNIDENNTSCDNV